MKRAMNDEAGRAITLPRYLGSRLLPLAVLVAAAVALGAPAAFLHLRVRELRVQAGSTARGVAELIRGEAALRPSLWRYDTLKLIEHVRAHEKEADVERIEIVGTDGRRLGLGAGEVLERLASADVLWSSVAIVIDAEPVGAVWVAVSAARVRREALLLLAPFSLLGLILAALIYGIPVRAAGRAERRIAALVAELDRSRRALSERGADLESEVRARASELSIAYADLQQKQARLRELSSRTAALEEDERRAIARELHDSVGQALTAIRIHLQLIGEAVPEGHAMRPVVAQAVAMTDETLEEVRRAVRTLGPAILDEIGLAEALERYCDDFAERSRVDVARTIALGEIPLSTAVESACYRIAQEALTNVAKHAFAGHVTLRLRAEEGLLVLDVEDDGRGFSESVRGNGRGILGMRERTELLGGSLRVSSTPGEGTRLHAELPVSPPASPID